MGGACQVWHCERQYRPVAGGAATLIVVFVAVMVAAPLDCIRSPVLLLLRGLAVLLMVTPSALIVMSALFRLTPVVLAALTALTPPAPAGMTTLNPTEAGG
jgi:hypothetical protein